MVTAFQMPDAGSRINATVHRIWKDWSEQYGNTTHDPGAVLSEYPFRILTIRMIQGHQIQLTDWEILAMQNFLTRVEPLDTWRDSDGVRGVIYDIHQSDFELSSQSQTGPSANDDRVFTQPEPSADTVNATNSNSGGSVAEPLIVDTSNDGAVQPTGDLAGTPTVEWVLIPAGDFIAGSSETQLELTLAECDATEGNCEVGWFDNEQPQETIFVDAFEIMKHEVSNRQYEECVSADTCRPAGQTISDSNFPYNPLFVEGAYPVVGVSHHDALAYCSWIGGRLPTHRQWEKAARGVDGRRYPWGDEFQAGNAALAASAPSAVGAHPGVSRYGVYDLAGNAFEWTASEGDDGRIILKGGSWATQYFRGRAADRGTQLPADFANYDIGFRCIR